MSRPPFQNESSRYPLVQRQSAARRQEPPPVPARTFTSEELFGDAIEIGIRHHGAHYRLKITRQGKLILNK